MYMKLVSPEGQARPLSIGASPRPRSLRGLRIGLLDNAKAPVDKMMLHIEAKLKEKYPGIETYTASKKAASSAADERMLKGLRDNCDVVINALGD
jgi:hypothetical protein